MFPSRQTPQNINQVESTRVDDHLILLFLGAASLSPESSRLRRTTNPGTTALERGGELGKRLETTPGSNSRD